MNNNNPLLNVNFQPKIPVQLIKAFVALFIVYYLISNSFVYINPGNIGIFINKVSGEVSDKPLEPGFKFKFIGFNEILEYPIFMQTVILSKSSVEGNPYNEEINVNSVEGQPISCDVSLSFELEPSKVPALYIMFRKDIHSISQGYVKQTVRQAVQQVVGNIEISDFLGKAKSTVVNDIQKNIQEKLKNYGFIIKQFTINEIRPPENVLKAIESKNIMAQEALRSKNQLKKVQFEAQHSVAEAEGKAQAILAEAQAQAQANTILSKSISPTLVRYKSVEKWDGKLSDVGSPNMPFIKE